MSYCSNTFIEVAEDCPATVASAPESKNGKKTIPVLQYEMIAKHPYKYTEEDILFETYANHNNIPAAKRLAERKKFLAQEQPCLRISALGKRYGWGVHCDSHGKVALVAIESTDYKRLASNPTLQHVKAFRSKRV